MQAFKPVSALVLALSISLSAGAASTAAAAASNSSGYGSAVHDASSVRTIVIKPDAKWVNVTNGETVTFIVGDQRFSYHFQTYRNTNSLPMAAIAPAELNLAGIRVYVAHAVQG